MQALDKPKLSNHPGRFGNPDHSLDSYKAPDPLLIKRQVAETKATEQRNLLLDIQEEIKSSLDDLNVQYPELKNQAQKVSNELKRLRLADTRQLLNNNQINKAPNEHIFIPIEAKHRIQNLENLKN